MDLPDLYYFNPACEIEIADGKPFYKPPKNPLALENDLELLPMVFARSQDYVAVSQIPSYGFVANLRGLFNVNPVLKSDLGQGKFKDFSFGKFVPWGISPRILNFKDNIGASFSSEYLSSPVSSFEIVHKQLFNRISSARIAAEFINNTSDKDLYINEKQLPVMARSVEKAIDFLKLHNSDNNEGTVFKVPVSSSGRGVRIFRRNSIDDNLIQWLSSVINDFGYVMCENFFNRVSDFSFHFDIQKSDIVYCGVSVFSTSENGYYLSSVIPTEEDALFAVNGFSKDIISKTADLLAECLKKSEFFSSYRGRLGVDCLTYLENGKLKINPCLEINCRLSMGAVAMSLQRIVREGRKASFHVIGAKDFNLYKADCQYKNGLIDKGCFWLTPKSSEKFAAVVCVDT